MDANKKVEVNGAFVADSQKRFAGFLVECEARRYKDRNAREPLRNCLKLFSIILHSQGFTQTVLRFLFRPVFFLFEVIKMTIAASASSLLIALLVEIELKSSS